MKTTDLLNHWSTLSLDEIEEELAVGQNLMAAEQLFGAEEVASMRAFEQTRSASSQREAVVLLPGLMGSLLTSVRGMITLLWLNPGLILRGQSRFLELNQNGTADASPQISTVAFSLEKLCYLKPALALNRACNLFEFPYDWRLRMEANADRLSEALERWAEDDPNMQFTLVGHSMGGIVARAFALRHREQAKRRVKRIIMHGSPQFGAAGAIADLMEGNRMMSIATSLNSNNTIRRFVLNMPSAYQLLPAPPDLFPKDRHYPANFDVYDASQWRLEGVRQDYLNEARQFHELLADFDHPVEIIQIAGCHLETKVDVVLDVDSRDRPRLQVINQRTGPDSGDATVPLYSARLPGAQMYFIQEVHRYLPRNDQVIQATIDLIQGRRPSLPTELPRPKGGFLGIFRSASDPTDDAEQLRQRLADGVATEQDLEQLYFLDY